jgi:hypothetical protein
MLRKFVGHVPRVGVLGLVRSTTGLATRPAPVTHTMALHTPLRPLARSTRATLLFGGRRALSDATTLKTLSAHEPKPGARFC